ncbi:MAG: type II secretion system F family protein [Chloroflexi bacterium]|nr:MAG: type II secretion system F family protein [Chloroflexota bacterium]TME72423.1 MAG: type II secretion system F family protein [Chloroflexota bacterium]TMG53502.1 MAG: type II secretion system F family protein [Chloroflexota bacterium]
MEILVLAGVVAFGVFLVFASFLVGQQLDPVQARLQQISVRPRTLEELELQRPIAERTLKPIVQGLAAIIARFYPANTARSLQLRLKRAAMETTSVEFFLGVKAFVGIVAAVAASALLNLMTSDPLFTVGGLFGGLILGFLIPDLYLSSRASGRAGAILDQLPDALDLLTISVEAGLGFDAAIIKVTEKMKGPLTEELKRAAAEQRVGKSRQESLRGINDRVEVKELQNLISAIIQADQLGVSMSKVLRIQSEQMRTDRRQRAEEKAARAPILIMLPTVGCIFPSLFIVILAPAALSAMKSCGSF